MLRHRATCWSVTFEVSRDGIGNEIMKVTGGMIDAISSNPFTILLLAIGSLLSGNVAIASAAFQHHLLHFGEASF